jgi:hypothetical protein
MLRTRLIALLLVVGAAGCSTDRGGEILGPLFFEEGAANTPEYREPGNNTMEGAISIPTDNTPVTQTLHVVGDDDYFRFDAAIGAQYVITATNIDRGMHFTVEARGTDTYFVDDFVTVTNEPKQLTYTPGKSGTYYIHVRGLSGGKPGAYELRVSVGPDGYEPNDALSAASSIGIDGVGQIHTLHSGGPDDDVDYIRLSTITTMSYRAYIDFGTDDATGSGPSDGWNIAVLDNVGGLVTSDIGTGLDTPEVVFTAVSVAVPVSDYFIRVSAQGGTGTYRLVVVVGDDSSEPDNTIAQAGSITPDAGVAIHSLTPGDVDLVSFIAITGKTYTIMTDMLSDGVDTKITLVSASGSALDDNDDDPDGGHGSQLTWTAMASGVYYIQVSSASSGRPGTYLLHVTSN